MFAEHKQSTGKYCSSRTTHAHTHTLHMISQQTRQKLSNVNQEIEILCTLQSAVHALCIKKLHTSDNLYITLSFVHAQ